MTKTKDSSKQMTVRPGVRTFGHAVRAARLCFYEYRRLNCWLRLTPYDTYINVEIVPMGTQIPNRIGASHKNRGHKVWTDAPEVLELSPAIRAIEKVTEIMAFDIDCETGELIK